MDTFCSWDCELTCFTPFRLQLVLATGPGNLRAFRVWTAKPAQFSSRPVQKPVPLTLGSPNPDLYPLTRGFRWVWQDPSVPISGSAFRVSHLWSHWDMLMLIVKLRHRYVTIHLECIGRLNNQNVKSYTPYHILKMRVNGVSTIVGSVSWVIWG